MIEVDISPLDAHGIITHPKVYPHVTDDNRVPPERYKCNPDHAYIVGYVDGQPAGFASLRVVNSITAEIHCAVLPEYRSRSRQIGRAIVAWIWDNTKAEKLVAQPHNANVQAYAKMMGFEVEGVNAGSFLVNGEIVDQTYMGLRRCQTVEQQQAQS